jgi:hypothetical protein
MEMGDTLLEAVFEDGSVADTSSSIYNVEGRLIAKEG